RDVRGLPHVLIRDAGNGTAGLSVDNENGVADLHVLVGEEPGDFRHLSRRAFKLLLQERDDGLRDRLGTSVLVLKEGGGGPGATLYDEPRSHQLVRFRLRKRGDGG